MRLLLRNMRKNMEEGRSDVKGKPHVHTRCQARETVNPITESEINALLQETERIIDKLRITA